MNQIDRQIEEILTLLLPEPMKIPQETKVIQDQLWGTITFYPWEILLLDSPLCQRLRQISQLGTVSLTYPSTNHNRFSHTIGVAGLAGRMINNLREKAEMIGFPVEITPREIHTVRLAALLHDVGHCFFSHTSEKILGPAVAEEQAKRGLADAKPHEYFAWLMLTHGHFKSFFDKWVAPLFPDADWIPDPRDIAQLIIGKHDIKNRSFLAEVLSGPYDVDRLEYLYRDAQMVGLDISYDMERYFQKISLVTMEEEGEMRWRLVMNIGGVRAVEQHIFSRMMLFSVVYHHHKVLAADCLVEDLLEEILHSNGEGEIVIRHPLDFLRYTDADLLATSIQGPGERFRRIRDRLVYRRLPRRCLVLAKTFALNEDRTPIAPEKWQKFEETVRGERELQLSLRKEIAQECALPSATFDDVHIILPKAPSISHHKKALVRDTGGRLETMTDHIDLDGWKKSYEQRKLRGYCFATAGMEAEMATAIEKVLQKRFGIVFDHHAREEAKL